MSIGNFTAKDREEAMHKIIISINYYSEQRMELYRGIIADWHSPLYPYLGFEEGNCWQRYYMSDISNSTDGFGKKGSRWMSCSKGPQ